MNVRERFRLTGLCPQPLPETDLLCKISPGAKVKPTGVWHKLPGDHGQDVQAL